MKQLCLLALLLAFPIAVHGEEQPIPLQPNTLTLSVDAEGKPSNVACLASVPEPACSILVRAVSGWKFVPGKTAGVNVAMNNLLRLMMEARPGPEGYGLHAVSASLLPDPVPHGAMDIEAQSRMLNPPRYPDEELRRGVTAGVTLELWRQPGTDLPRVGKVWIDGRPARNRDKLAQSAIVAARKWRLTPGNPNQLSTCIVVDYLHDLSQLSKGTGPCEPTFVDGYALPILLTDFRTAIF